MYNAFHRKGDVDRLYIKRTGYFRGPISIEECVLIEDCQNEYVYIKPKPMINAVARKVILKGSQERIRKQLKRLRKKKKSLHSIFFSKTEFKDSRRWDWLKYGTCKKLQRIH